MGTAPAPKVTTAPPPKPAGPQRISGGVMAGTIVEKTQPIYPPIARAAHVSGAVVLHAIIGKNGTIQNLQVISGPEMLRASALDAVQHWRYKPYLLNNEPTEVDTTTILQQAPASVSTRLPEADPADDSRLHPSVRIHRVQLKHHIPEERFQ
jgi:TonB family protein